MLLARGTSTEICLATARTMTHLESAEDRQGKRFGAVWPIHSQSPRGHRDETQAGPWLGVLGGHRVGWARRACARLGFRAPPGYVLVTSRAMRDPNWGISYSYLLQFAVVQGSVLALSDFNNQA